MLRRCGAVACLVLFVWTAGCREPASDASDPPRLSETIGFVVDGEGVQYFYRDSHAGTRSVRRLASIPLAHRGAVRIYEHESLADAPPAREGEPTVYVADLFGAEPGETAHAHRMSRRAFSARALGGELAHRRGVWVELVAREMAKMADDSIRRDKAAKARELFEQMLPTDSNARETLEREERLRREAAHILQDERNDSESK